jgi:hypothetical protein
VSDVPSTYKVKLRARERERRKETPCALPQKNKDPPRERANVVQRHKEKRANSKNVGVKKRGWGGGQKQNIDVWCIRIPYAPNNDTGCEKTTNVEIANTDCVTTINYPKEVKGRQMRWR